MRKQTVTITAALFMTAGLIGCKKTNITGELIKIDPYINYPEKKLNLQDFMDVEYIPLETNDEFITQGDLLAVGSRYLFVKNWTNDGDIFLFDRSTGKGLGKINHKGQGPKEYTFISGVVWDEDHNELFINCTQTKTIQVYDLSGNYKRSIKHAGDAQYLNIYNFDKKNLICYDASVYQKNGQTKDCPSFHSIISKQDGHTTQQFNIPFETVKAPMLMKDGAVVSIPILPIIPCDKDWLLVESSTDTIYTYSSEHQKLSPLLVKMQVEDPDFLLTMGIVTDQFYFIAAIKKEFDFTTGQGFPTTSLMYDKQAHALYQPVVLNGDYTIEKKVNMSSTPLNNNIATFQILTANRLREALDKNQLKGNLREIAANLEEDSNPVLMLIKNVNMRK